MLLAVVAGLTFAVLRITAAMKTGSTKTAAARALSPLETMVRLPGGSFQMGCSPGDGQCDDVELPAHPVTLHSFWIDVTEVTNEQYAPCVQARACTPAHHAGDVRWNGATQPVLWVDWNQAAAYCRWSGGRLPTEAEWEYAARAGTTGPRYGDLDATAWYAANSGDVTHPVARKQPNPWGLYDMLGNAWEWTADWYDERYYKSSPASNPPGPPSGSARVFRGGGWDALPGGVRASFRGYYGPGSWALGAGFRCVRD